MAENLRKVEKLLVHFPDLVQEFKEYLPKPVPKK
jgi:hypothetical protein